LVEEDNLNGFVEMTRKLGVEEIVGVRGNSEFIDDYMFENEPVDTKMWNPLHFAVYHGRLSIVKFIIEKMQVNIGMTAPKPFFDQEQDDCQGGDFPEDKIMLIRLAYDRGNGKVLAYLLDNLYRWMPNIAVKKIIENV
jgi:hypothetical protein